MGEPHPGGGTVLFLAGAGFGAFHHAGGYERVHQSYRGTAVSRHLPAVCAQSRLQQIHLERMAVPGLFHGDRRAVLSVFCAR